MATLVADSTIYGGAWSTPEMRAVFDEVARTREWLEIVAVLAETQASFGLIPREAARDAATACRAVTVDATFLDEARAGYEASGHSLVGLLDAVAARCPGEGGEWLCFGTTVQDITDTWLMTALRTARSAIAADLATVDDGLARLAREHRDTVMAGRTHGQVGLPITFGFKVAGWLAEVRRHRRRLDEIDDRLGVGQLAGGVGSLAAQGPRGLEVQATFLHALGLRPPDISWTSSRDLLAEWCGLLTLITATADRIGHEVYNLQRPEIGEVGEGFVDGTVGSITMPHKRNPERSEHLGTLARVVRHDAAIVAESLVHEHERDGRSWKVEWQAIPGATLAAGKAVRLLGELIATLWVDPDRMQANLAATQGAAASERVMLALAGRVGRRTAHRMVHEATMQGAAEGRPVRDAVLDAPAIVEALGIDALTAILDAPPDTGRCGEMVDRVLGDAS